MILHILNIFFSIVVIETIFFSKFFYKLNVSIKLVNTILKITFSKKTSDDYKEKEIFKNSKNLILNSFKILFVLITIILFFILINYFYSSFSNYFISIVGLSETTITIILYLILRKLVNAKL